MGELESTSRIRRRGRAGSRAMVQAGSKRKARGQRTGRVAGIAWQDAAETRQGHG